MRFINVMMRLGIRHKLILHVILINQFVIPWIQNAQANHKLTIGHRTKNLKSE